MVGCKGGRGEGSREWLFVNRLGSISIFYHLARPYLHILDDYSGSSCRATILSKNWLTV